MPVAKLKPPPADPERYDSGCLGKQRYTSQEAAEQALALMRKGRVKHWKGNLRDPLFVYACDFCGGWHWGH